MYKNMALASCLLSFAYSKFNADINDENKIVILNQMHMSDKEPKSDNYTCLIMTEEFMHLSESNEYSDELNYSCAPNTEEHVDLYHICLDEYCKNDKSLADIRVKQIDPIYYETCMEFLDSVKVLTYS